MSQFTVTENLLVGEEGFEALLLDTNNDSDGTIAALEEATRVLNGGLKGVEFREVVQRARLLNRRLSGHLRPGAMGYGCLAERDWRGEAIRFEAIERTWEANQLAAQEPTQAEIDEWIADSQAYDAEYEAYLQDMAEAMNWDGRYDLPAPYDF